MEENQEIRKALGERSRNTQTNMMIRNLDRWSPLNDASRELNEGFPALSQKGCSLVDSMDRAKNYRYAEIWKTDAEGGKLIDKGDQIN